MNTISFNVDEFPKLSEEFYAQNYTNWITFLHDMGYKFKWNYYASKHKYIEMSEADFVWFKLRWA